MIIFVSLIIVSGFVAVSYLHLKHIQKLEILIKATSLSEVKSYEEPKVEYVENPQPDSLQDAIIGKESDEIRQMFRSTPVT